MKEKFLCPSAPLYEGSKLLGVVKENSVDILSAPIEVDDVFIKAANTGKVAEQKFRFVNKCVKSGCEQWTGSECGVIKRVLTAVEEKIQNEQLPPCSIRPECRWYAQEGSMACKACPTVRYI
jgi:hypothetical protein